MHHRLNDLFGPKFGVGGVFFTVCEVNTVSTPRSQSIPARRAFMELRRVGILAIFVSTSLHSSDFRRVSRETSREA